MWPFKAFLIVHVIAGAIGLVLFWVPIFSRKGGQAHRKYGRAFAYLMYIAASLAIGMGTNTIVAPIETHPHLDNAEWVRGIFGWMMVYLGILTISLVRHGLIAVENKRQHAANRHPVDVCLQLLTIAAALNCAWRGWRIDQPLMMGIAVVGIASGATNLLFAFRAHPRRQMYLLEHVKAIVGSGISVYTAFMAFGFVRLLPSHALNPKMWSIPLLTGLTLIIYHQARILLAARSTK